MRVAPRLRRGRIRRGGEPAFAVEEKEPLRVEKDRDAVAAGNPVNVVHQRHPARAAGVAAEFAVNMDKALRASQLRAGGIALLMADS